MCIICCDKTKLLPTENFSDRFGQIYICENCKRYYAKVGAYYYEVKLVYNDLGRNSVRWKMCL